MKILVWGGRGQAGVEFVRLAQSHGIAVAAPTRSELDVRSYDRLRKYIEQAHADVVVNFAAFHNLEDCERSFLDALAVNAASVREMAFASCRTGARLITISTDYVFDGKSRTPYTEEDEALPIQAYGISKRAGELAALAVAPSMTMVVRTCGLYGHSGSRTRGPNFVERRLQELSNQKQIEVGSDLRCTPTSAVAFTEALFALCQLKEVEGGIYHLTAEGECSWAEFTAEIAGLAGRNCKVIGVDRQGNYGAVKRPAYSVLANRRAAAFGIRLPGWREALACYLENRKRD